MQTHTLTTGFAYSTYSGKIVGKYAQGAGDAVALSDGCTITDVANQATLDAITIYVDPVANFNVNQFCEALYTSFAIDSNLFPYYAVLKDLANFRNFAGMNTIVNALLTANILTSAEVTTLTGILAAQNITLSNYTS